MKKVVRIGSRESKLAVWQAEHVAHTIEQAHPEIEVQIITMKTTGDRILDRNLDQVGGKGLFVKELDIALMEKRTDLSVHSLKDMPMEVSEALPILAYSKREDPRDVLLFRKGTDNVKVIGTSSRRRQVQLEKLYPDCIFTGMRGNVQTRLRKLEEGMCDATVLAMAGLKRLGMESAAGRILDPEEVIPAAGQGILAVQGRAGEDYYYLDCIMDQDGRTAALAERAFVRMLDGGCSSPIAAYAQITDGQVILSGLYYNEETGSYIIGKKQGPEKDAERIGRTLAAELKERFEVRG
ncbi:hydroxymethylbilane synthase [Faecalicatena contorta]|uniref:hydroxymethylbilane synthase n=1 Tax=Faecalicatena contorta TaxID=39482 RepID=UPI001EEE6C34|nr:hydroxymethylbilane synthase [Faecalicatena contorta]MCF2682267.1 hydroxymethylbilane synthase [Faecalicatena contorta]